MRKFIFVGILVLAMSGLALAQDFPKYEVFGGYSFLRSDLGNSSLGSFFNSDFSSGISNGHGFEASFTYNLNKWFGIKGDFSTHFNKLKMDGKDVFINDVGDGSSTDTHTQTGSADFRQYTYLFGPEFSYRGNEKFRPFAHMLFGFTQLDVHKFSVKLDQPDDGFMQSANGTLKGTSFAMAMGGGVDIAVNKKVSLRLPQVDYILPTFREIREYGNEKCRVLTMDLRSLPPSLRLECPWTNFTTYGFPPGLCLSSN